MSGASVMLFNEDQQQALELMCSLMEASSKQTAALTNSLMDQYQEDAKLARAELRAVRIQMTKLFDSDYMPSESAIFNALYPDSRLVEALMEAK
jgi:hypothetical protein